MTDIKDHDDFDADEDDYVGAQDAAGDHGKIRINSLMTRYIQIVVFDFATTVETGDGKYYIHIPPKFDNMELTYVHAKVITAGTTGTLDIQIHNIDNALDMLSTTLTVDSGELGSHDAATPAVINTSNDHVNTNDVLRVDVDAVHSGTAPIGLILTLGLKRPMP